MDYTELGVDTGQDLVTDITSYVDDIHVQFGWDDGLMHLFAPHATAGLALMETGSGSEDDLAAAVGRLFPRDEPYAHAHGSAGHGADHVLPVFVSPSLVLVVRQGQMMLGQWQSIVLVDPNPDNTERTVLIHFLGE